MNTTIQPTVSVDDLHDLMMHADAQCKTFDPQSKAYEFLLEKFNQANTTTYHLMVDHQPVAMAIIEILDRHYGNLIVHCMHESDEAAFAQLLVPVIGKNILELIQFRSNFNYRDAFMSAGLQEKERARMIHNDVGRFIDWPAPDNIYVTPLTHDYNDICGEISFNAHKHRQHIEQYDVYYSAKNRAKFAQALRNNDHGHIIESASLLMMHELTPIGLLEMVDVQYFDESIGWIMDVALLPSFQGLGYGQYLIKKALGEAYMAGYSKVGLGVTLSNQSAYRLYETLGFEEYEIFVEVMGQ